jgi:ABC-2 type transport system ATP-binding protein
VALRVEEGRMLGSRFTSAKCCRSILLFDRVDRQQLAALGEVRTPSLADLFVAVIGNSSNQAQGAIR